MSGKVFKSPFHWKGCSLRLCSGTLLYFSTLLEPGAHFLSPCEHQKPGLQLPYPVSGSWPSRITMALVSAYPSGFEFPLFLPPLSLSLDMIFRTSSLFCCILFSISKFVARWESRTFVISICHIARSQNDPMGNTMSLPACRKHHPSGAGALQWEKLCDVWEGSSAWESAGKLVYMYECTRAVQKVPRHVI